MNKVLLHNFPRILKQYKIDVAEDPDLMCGDNKAVDYISTEMHLPKSHDPIIPKLRSDILSALILHEKLCIDIYDVIHLLNLFGTDNIINFLASKSIEVYDDLGPDVGAITKYPDTFKLVTAKVFNADTTSINKLSWLEKTLSKLSAIPSNNIDPDKINKILTLIVSNTVISPKEFVDDLLFKETSYDLKNKNVTGLFKIHSDNCEAINKDDLLNVVRLHYINRGLVDAQRINSDSIIVDNWAKIFIQEKISPVINDLTLHSSADIFQDTILSKKGIPDLNLLFENNIIDADDIIGFRNTVDGKLFRKWISGTNYEPEVILSTLLSKKHPSLIARIMKPMRIIYPTVAGLINPHIGVIASIFDSYIVQKIMEGWHPSLFLDDKLKFTIDKNIELSKKQNKLDKLIKIHGKIGRNDPCPCGSGNKFKKCCGR